eukprot:81922-Prorocentrum_minimum.AAC.1
MLAHVVAPTPAHLQQHLRARRASAREASENERQSHGCAAEAPGSIEGTERDPHTRHARHGNAVFVQKMDPGASVAHPSSQ